MERISERHMGRRVQALLMVYVGEYHVHRPDEFRILSVDKRSFTYKVDGASYIGTLDRRRWRVLKILD